MKVFALLIVAALARTVSAEPPADYTVVVHVQNEAAVAPWVLRAAEKETTRVFRQMGVELRWRDANPVSGEDRGVPEVSIVLMSAAMGAQKSQTEHTPDQALASASRRTGRAYVFCDRIASLADRYAFSEGEASVVLSHTFTHELGHMLASVGHDTVGAMRASMEMRQGGFFGFSDAQKRAIRQALAEAMATEVPQLALRVAP